MAPLPDSVRPPCPELLLHGMDFTFCHRPVRHRLQPSVTRQHLRRTITCGSFFSAAVKSDGSICVWGSDADNVVASTPVETVASALSVEQVLTQITTMVAEATGYTTDELEPQLELEAELGIDTVKQAELLVVVRETFGIDEKVEVVLSELNTLENLARFVLEHSGGKAEVLQRKASEKSEAAPTIGEAVSATTVTSTLSLIHI